MRSFVVLIVALALLAVGCEPVDPFFSWPDADGYYEGHVYIDRPGMGFDHSFCASLRIYNDCYCAVLIDDCGKSYDADSVDYDSWSDNLEIRFHVWEKRWSYECGDELYKWEIRMKGRLDYNDGFRGEMISDLDPGTYQSDHCRLDHDPPPRSVGTFVFDYESNPW